MSACPNERTVAVAVILLVKSIVVPLTRVLVFLFAAELVFAMVDIIRTSLEAYPLPKVKVTVLPVGDPDLVTLPVRGM